LERTIRAVVGGSRNAEHESVSVLNLGRAGARAVSDGKGAVEEAAKIISDFIVWIPRFLLSARRGISRIALEHAAHIIRRSGQKDSDGGRDVDHDPRAKTSR
jgi:hypothetical protein